MTGMRDAVAVIFVRVFKKLAQILIILILVTFGATALANLIPGDPARLVLGEFATPGALAQVDKEYGFTKPLYERYWNWLAGAVHGDLGNSIQTHQSVTSLIGQFAPATFEVAIFSLVLSLLVAIPLAAVASQRRDGVLDRALTAVTSVLTAVPVFVSSVLLVFLLSVAFKLLPPSGWANLFQDPADNLSHAALPVITLVLTITPLFMRVLRGDIAKVMQQEYVLTARARGLPEWYVFTRHVLRPASLSLITVAGIVFGTLFGGSIIVETFFGIPGLGQLVSQAVFNKDIPIVQGVVVVVAIVFLLINVLVDLLVLVIDPRTRAAGE
jgi:peptide/nickel transport system permease protein